MIDVSKLPAVRAQLEQAAAAAKKETAEPSQGAAVEYARAPEGDGHTAVLNRQGGQR